MKSYNKVNEFHFHQEKILIRTPAVATFYTIRKMTNRTTRPFHRWPKRKSRRDQLVRVGLKPGLPPSDVLMGQWAPLASERAKVTKRRL